jgi:hypothetical protein
MPSSGPNIGFGFQRLLDTQLNYLQTGHPVYYRVRNFPDIQNQEYAQLGFSISPSGTPVGTTDTLILPPPAVSPISMHSIGMSMGRLRFGAKSFEISASWVDQQVRLAGGTVNDPTSQDLIFRGPNVVGLVCDNLLWSIELPTHFELGGKTVAWILQCNANELR